ETVPIELQWGHGLEAVEWGDLASKIRGESKASMGPRLGGRGMRRRLPRHCRLQRASMGPRLGGRGMDLAFLVGGRIRAALASMGPRLGGRGMGSYVSPGLPKSYDRL